MWGEGFIDRRHPHTYVHELMVGTIRQWRCGQGRTRCGAGIAAGKGFAAFGSEDPMTRGVARYPINHHWAQVLERAVITGQLEFGPAMLEGSLFNGDEPQRPGDWPSIERFGDSWSARATLAPARGLAASVSLATVKSPDHRAGAGPAQRKVHAELRYATAAGSGLIEWARTSEADGFFVFRSFLAEGGWRRGRGRVYYRFERTERPEEERLSVFRTARPRVENSLLGITRWTLHTIGATAMLAGRTVGGAASPFLEATIGRASEVGPGLFRIVDQYGTNAVRSLSVGVRVGWRMAGHRMGRYGLAGPHAPPA
jgi:hypothetical protein